MRYFVVSDVHGFYDELKIALQDAGFDAEKDTLISCGDLVDRGDKPIETIEFVLSCPNRICIQGNHEDLMNEMIDRGVALSHDRSNGTYSSAIKMGGSIFGMRDNELWKTYQKQCYNAAVIGDYIFTHGYVPCARVPSFKEGCGITKPNYNYKLLDWKSPYRSDWIKARWENGMEAAASGAKVPNMTVVCGHFHSSWGNVRKLFLGLSDREYRGLEFSDNKMFDIFYGDGVIGIDGCTAYTEKVNVFTFESDAEVELI